LQALALKVTATDTSGLSISETFQAAVSASAPVLTQQTPAQAWAAGRIFSLAIPSGAFTDPQGETLSYTAAQSNGQALPGWLAFNAATDTFSGMAPSGMQPLAFKVTATDTSGLSTSETFQATAAIAAPTLAAPCPAPVWTAGQAFSLVIPSGAFVDPQGQALTYSAMLTTGQALPSWLIFNAATDTFSGTAPASIQTVAFMAKATNTSGMSTAAVIRASVSASAPVLAQQTATQTWTAGQAFSLALPSGAFTDPQGEALSYTAALSGGQALPAWLAFNAAAGTFSGTAPNALQTVALTVTATDTSGLASSETFQATVGALVVTGASTGYSMLTGGSGPTVINGFGHDIITGGTGQTTINTGGGSDKITLASSVPATTATTINSGGGDTIWAGSGTVNVQASGSKGDSIYSQASQMSFINGSIASEILAGGTGTVTVQAGTAGAPTMPARAAAAI